MKIYEKIEVVVGRYCDICNTRMMVDSNGVQQEEVGQQPVD
ncbi:hypothetical protein [Salinivibrio kushneri]|nr:hypothetical protein [Salinivibrio kushneri]